MTSLLPSPAKVVGWEAAIAFLNRVRVDAERKPAFLKHQYKEFRAVLAKPEAKAAFDSYVKQVAPNVLDAAKRK